jgi:hypothetical protein
MANYSTIRGSGSGGGSGGGVTAYANYAALPTSGNSEGDLGFTQDTDALYVWDGTAWDRVDSGDESPVILTDPPATHDLNAGGGTTSLSMTAQDPEGFDIVYGIAYKTANNARPTQLGADTTINQSTGTYTFTPSTNTAHSGTFKARLSASDGANVTTRFVDVELDFSMDLQYLAVAGGGGGGGVGGAGGGGGGMLEQTIASTDRGRTYTITVGTGGTGGNGWYVGGTAGTDSIISATGTSGWTTVTAKGGGQGGSNGGGGGNGGSGGGASHSDAGGASVYSAGTGVYPGSTYLDQARQGYDGGSAGVHYGAGGGGAGGVGANANQGAGGIGAQSSITGTAVYYAGGAGGGGGTAGTSDYGGTSSGGLGGGGDGGISSTAGTDGLGGGGGGGARGYGNVGKDGGDGVVIIRTTATALSTTGSPTVTTDGSYNIYSFTANGTIAF